MIHEVTGDLLLSKADLIVHGLAPHDDCRHGLALTLRERFPAMYRDFRHWCKTTSPRPGGLWEWSGKDQQGRTVRIAALLTQEPPARPGAHPGPAHTEYLNHALHELRKRLEREPVRSVALPRIATGVGHLPWEQVEPLLRAQLGNLPVHVFLYTRYAAGVAADESTAPGAG